MEKHFTHFLPEAGNPIKDFGNLFLIRQSQLEQKRSEIRFLEHELVKLEKEIIEEAESEWTVEEIKKAMKESDYKLLHHNTKYDTIK